MPYILPARRNGNVWLQEGRREGLIKRVLVKTTTDCFTKLPVMCVCVCVCVCLSWLQVNSSTEKKFTFHEIIFNTSQFNTNQLM